MAINRFTVAPRFGQFPAVELLNADLRRILSRRLPLTSGCGRRKRLRFVAVCRDAPAAVV